MIERTVLRGLSEEWGSWKTICMSRRASRISALAEQRQVAPIEYDATRRRLGQPQDAAAQRGLARSRFPDKPHGFAARYVEIDPVDSFQHRTAAAEEAAIDRIVLGNALDEDERLIRHGASTSRDGRAWLRPKPALPFRSGRSASDSASGSCSRAADWKGSAPLPEWPAAACRPPAPPEARDRSHQSERIGMQRLVEEIVHRRLLEDLARIHDGDSVGHLGHHTEIVSDQND